MAHLVGICTPTSGQWFSVESCLRKLGVSERRVVYGCPHAPRYMMIQEFAANQAPPYLKCLLRNCEPSQVHNKHPLFAVGTCLAIQHRRTYDHVGLALWTLRDRCIGINHELMSTRLTKVWRIVTDAECQQTAWKVCVSLPALLQVVRITVVPRLNAFVASTANKAHASSHFVLLSGGLFLLDPPYKILGENHFCYLS